MPRNEQSSLRRPQRQHARPKAMAYRPSGHAGDHPKGRMARRERLEVSHLVERVEELEGRRAAARWALDCFPAASLAMQNGRPEWLPQPWLDF